MPGTERIRFKYLVILKRKTASTFTLIVYGIEGGEANLAGILFIGLWYCCTCLSWPHCIIAEHNPAHHIKVLLHLDNGLHWMMYPEHPNGRGQGRRRWQGGRKSGKGRKNAQSINNAKVHPPTTGNKQKQKQRNRKAEEVE